MRSIIETLKNKQILLASVAMFIMHIFIAGSIIFVLLADDQVYVSGTNSRTEGYIAIGVSSLIGFVISSVIYLFSISRIRGIWAFIICIIPLIILLITSFIPGTQAFLVVPMVSTILLLSILMGYFIFGLSNWLYFKMKNLYFALTILAFWHFGTIIVYIADKIGYSTNSIEEVLSKVSSAWDITTIGLISGFIILAAILLLIDSKILLSRWSKNMRKESRIGIRNLGVVGCLFTIALFITLLVAPAFWRLHWEEVERNEQIRQEQQEQEQERQERERQSEERKQPPPQFDRPQQSPENDGDQFNSGGRLESGIPLGDGVPIFAVKLGEGEAISAQNKVIFTSNEQSIEDKREFLWRSEVYDKYNDFDGFTKNTLYNKNEYSLNKQQGYYYSGVDTKYESTEVLEQRYVILTVESQEVFSANRPIEVSYQTEFNVPYFFGFTNDSIITDERQLLEPESRYFSRSEVFTGEESLLKQVAARIGFTDTEIQPRYTFDLNYDIYSLAYEITSGKTNDYDKVKAIESYLRENYIYESNEESNSEILRDSDINEFLLTTKKGDVTHFAFAMVMLLDQLEIDSRVASGFYQGEYDPSLEGYVVRDNDFTFWVEVFFNGYGWIEYQPAGSSDDIQEQRQTQGNFDQPLTQEEQNDLQDDFENLEELEEFDQQLEEKRDQWEQNNDTPTITPSPQELFPSDTPSPTPTPTPEPEESENSFLKLLEAIWNVIKKIWWLVCSGIILMIIVIPIILKQFKYAWRRGTFNNWSDKKQIKQYFLLMQDVLSDFSDQLRLPETAYQFSERFVKEFPIEKKPKSLNDQLYIFATIYNRAIYADNIKEDDRETMEQLTNQIINKYLQSKGWKAFLRWYNPSGLTN